MPDINHEVYCPYEPSAMFALVNDVKAYPHFLPWCSQTIVQEESDTYMLATLKVSAGPVKFQFTTANTLEEPSTITVRYHDGPFSNFDGKWQFKAVDEGCKVKFTLNYKFSNNVLEKIARPVFDNLLAALVDNFEKRAKFLYGAK